MLIPIALGLAWPDRVPDTAPPVDWTQAETWEFFPLDDEAFPAVRLARAGRASAGGTAPAVYNAANEVARRGVPCTDGWGSSEIVDTVAARARVARRTLEGAARPSTTSWPPTPGPATRPPVARSKRAQHDRPLYLLGCRGLRGRDPGLDRPARARPHDPGEEVRREGHAVLHRLRPHGLEPQRGETEYGVKAIPLGGYVKIVGMLPPDAEHADEVEYDADGNRVVKVRKSNTGMFTQLISDARAAEWETITAADEDRLFYKMAWWKKVVVMAGGPTVNLLIAFFIFAGRLRDLRQPDDEADPTRRSTRSSACVIPAAEDGRVCTADDPVSPAAQAGLQAGRPVRRRSTARRSRTGTSCRR